MPARTATVGMAVADRRLIGLGYEKPSSETPVARLSDQGEAIAVATVAEEVPIALVYNARPHVVVMGTPADLEDLAVGFSLTEGVVEDPRAVERVEVIHASHGIEIQVQISSTDAERLLDRARGMVSRTGCGLCGIETIHEAIRIPATLAHTLDISRDALWRAGEALSHEQTLNNVTSTVHAAAWANVFGELQLVREDVGRHNALDKVLGAMARGGMPAHDGFLVITSRASYEMVQKAAVRGVELVAAISRPTGLAIRVAMQCGVTLVGLLRGRTANVYSRPERIT
jgi:FdhD protein